MVVLSQNKLLTFFWYLNFEYTLRDLGVIQKFNSSVRCSLHQGWRSTRWTQRCVDLLNDLNFSLCGVPSVCHMVTTSNNRKKSEIEVSTNLVCRYWTLEIEFNKNLSLLIIRLVNYSITTSLIYEFCYKLKSLALDK